MGLEARNYVRVNVAATQGTVDTPTAPGNSRIVLTGIHASREFGGAATVFSVFIRRKSDSRAEHRLAVGHAPGALVSIEDPGPYVSDLGDGFELIVDGVDGPNVSLHAPYYIQVGG